VGGDLKYPRGNGIKVGVNWVGGISGVTGKRSALAMRGVGGVVLVFLKG
jgi:hypothetical protein